MSITFHGACKYAHDRCRCTICRKANTFKVMRSRRLRRQFLVDGPGGRQVTTADVPHGRATTYQNWFCRCLDCSAAHAAVMHRAYLRRTQKGA